MKRPKILPEPLVPWHARAYDGDMNSSRGREIAEQRRSGAAGLHVKWTKDRANAEREAIQAELDAEEGDE